ncbi:BamA/TamA family outer membrane protein [Vibrio parahaemolyticus]|uniref:BamA/TamA family outer membrane protein n=1 Tax=Vibrio parahaemolyticus TaxID=670 RepID=UPI0003590919|nr:BamA/TamA family outer membrane protein [Vibrio parahaemolyticus]AGQ92707.1 membrane protein [Vibrio parahaemolyticus O1:Kuk str. FDA_R31]EHK0043803.1 BamA/TamA family outer membrane protein [Vibrio parahaemolyticus]EHR6401550.1 BamA/TamA family outer membrane protein [Vibrio parahaemolyticus]EIU7879690.1 BamA/TamA family outer membrane protein [Vibrio parahaemolyticus]EJB0393866.1 BamA/TamA family outer membrane protein [Vibrio parahaemolyticus]
MKASYTLALTALLSSSYAIAIEKDESSLMDDILTKLGSSETVDESKLIDWGVLPGPFVNPEQGFGIGVAAVGLYMPYDWQKGEPYSTVTVTSYGSTSGSYGLGLNNRTYLKNDKVRLLGEAWISHTPGYYWGIGSQAAENENNKVQYEGQRLQLSPKIAVEVAPNTYAKLGWQWQSFSKVDGVEGDILPSEVADATSSGVLVGMEYDTRDFEPNPMRGQFLDVEWIANRDSLGSDEDYDNLVANYRVYQQWSDTTIIAMEVYSQSIFGDAPWFDYAQLGDDQRMRGYYQGQYRDKHLLSTQVEIRHTIAGRHGVVGWLGAGNIAPTYHELFENSWLPTVGVGYRFAFKARINVRVDLGVGKDSTGFYFQINEAF